MSNLKVIGPLRRVAVVKHLGPGPHPSGSDQDVHAGDRAGASQEPLSPRWMIPLERWERVTPRGHGINEDGRIFTEEGEVVYAIDQGEFGVSFPLDDMVRLKKNDIAFVVTHTHPTESTFSMADVIETMWDDAAEVRAVSENFVFRMGFDVDADFTQQVKFSDYVKDEENGVFKRTMVRVREIFAEEGKPDMDDADARAAASHDVYSRAINEVYRGFWKKSAERFPEVIEYYIEEPR